MRRKREFFNLPDGSTSTSTKEYVSAWRKLAEPICREFGWGVLGYDPGITFLTGKNGGSVGSVVGVAGASDAIHLPTTLCLKIRDLISECNILAATRTSRIREGNTHENEKNTHENEKTRSEKRTSSVRN